MRATRNNVAADWTISLRWDEKRKTWDVMVQDRRGRVADRLVAETTVAVDRYVARDLLRAVQRELEMLLPF